MIHSDWTRETFIELVKIEMEAKEDVCRDIRHGHGCPAEGCDGLLADGDFYSVAGGDGVRIVSRFVQVCILEIFLPLRRLTEPLIGIFCF